MYNITRPSERMPWFTGQPLLSYLEKTDYDGYKELIKRLELRR